MSIQMSEKGDFRFYKTVMHLQKRPVFFEVGNVNDVGRQEIAVTCNTHQDGENYRLVFKIIVKTNEVQKCIIQLLKNPQVRSTIPKVHSIKIHIPSREDTERKTKAGESSKHENATVGFKLENESDLDLFIAYAKGTLNPESYAIEGEVDEENDHWAVVTDLKTDKAVTQIKRTNDLFQIFVHRFEKSGINPALKALKRREFPKKEVFVNDPILEKQPLLEKTVLVEEDGASEILRDSLKNTFWQTSKEISNEVMNEIRLWMVNPKAQRKLEFDYVANAFKEAIEFKPINLPRLKSAITIARLRFEDWKTLFKSALEEAVRLILLVNPDDLDVPLLMGTEINISSHDLNQQVMKEYKKLCAEFPQLEPSEHPKLFETGIKARWKNRYINILPNEPTRFKFKNPDDYYNANSVLEGIVIAAEGPTNHGKKGFWQMVWESESDTIVMLTDVVENKREKCAIYWPQQKGVVEDVDHQTTCNMIDESAKPVGEFEIRTRKFLLKRGNEERIVSQYHFCGWKDHKVISPKILADFTAEIEAKKSKGPLVVHCSAGIGRTGTFITIYFAYLNLMKGVKDAQMVFDIARELRSPIKGRNGMIQNGEQYLLIHETVKELSKTIA